MGGPSVNTQAQQAEQNNQKQAQAYSAQQQAAALAAVQAWTKANPPPNSTAAPLQMPGASSPATIGGGTAPGSAGAPGSMPGQMRPPQGAMPGQQPQAQPGQPGMPPAAQGAPQQPQQQKQPNLNPQQVQAIIARLSGQTAPKAL